MTFLPQTIPFLLLTDTVCWQLVYKKDTVSCEFALINDGRWRLCRTWWSQQPQISTPNFRSWEKRIFLQKIHLIILLHHSQFAELKGTLSLYDFNFFFKYFSVIFMWHCKTSQKCPYDGVSDVLVAILMGTFYITSKSQRLTMQYYISPRWYCMIL